MSDQVHSPSHYNQFSKEVKDIIPSAYQESGDMIGLNFNPIVAALTKAVQELKQELDGQGSKIEKLEVKVDILQDAVLRFHLGSIS